MITDETSALSNGVSIPKFALGTWLMGNEEAKHASAAALKMGYRHIDTAQAYGNEQGVGRGVRESGVPRGEIFVTTKVQAEIKDYDTAAQSIDKSLGDLNMDYADLIIIHCPQPWAEFRNPKKRYFEENRQVWKALEDAYKAGKTKSIGVSNFLTDDMENIMQGCEIRPMVNQILAHIGNVPFDILEFCGKNSIAVEAYSPIAHGAALNNDSVRDMAEKYGVSAAQLCLRYDLQLNMIVLPKTSNPEHMADNLKVDFTISDDDMRTLSSVRGLKQLW